MSLWIGRWLSAPFLVRMREGGKIATAQASDTDTVVASARAYVQCLNKLLVRREKSAPEAAAE